MWDEHFVKYSRPVRWGKNTFIDSQGEFKFRVFLKFLNGNFISQPENRRYKYFRPDFRLDYYDGNDLHPKRNSCLADWKKVFTLKDYEKACGMLNVEFINNYPCDKIFYPTDIFVGELRDGYCRNICNGEAGIRGFIWRFNWLFKKCFELSTKPIKCVDCDKVFYPYNFDFFGGSPDCAVFPATDGVNLWLLNYKKYSVGYYNGIISSFVLPTCAAYFNIARIQFDDFPAGRWWDDRFDVEKDFYYPKSELLPFKMHDKKGRFHPLQKKEFDLVTTQNIINILNEVTQTKERILNATN